MNESENPSLAVERLKFDADHPIHATKIVNIIYLAPTPLLPGAFPSDMNSEEHELHLLEKGLQTLKDTSRKRRDDIESRKDAGEKVSDADDEWLDQSGNFIMEQILIDKFLVAKDNEPYCFAYHEYQAIQSIISSYQATLVEAATKKMNKRKKHLTTDDLSNGQCKRPRSHLSKPVQSERSSREPSKHKQSLTYIQRLEVIDWYYANGESQTKTYLHFSKIYCNMGISQPNISRWLKEKDSIRKIATNTGPQTKQKADVKFPEIEELLVTWCRMCEQTGQFVTGEQIKEKWHHFARMKNIDSKKWLTLTGGWLDSFKTRHGLREFKRHGEAGSARPETVTAERERIKEIVAEYGPGDVYNMDETGLFYA